MLKESLIRNGLRTLFIVSDPDNVDFTKEFGDAIYYTMKFSDIEPESFTALDRRNIEQTAKLAAESNFIVLGGAHVPTQNHFFEETGLKEIMMTYQGTIMGISAGSMNSADVVYAQPEESGEADNQEYQRFLHGLDITKTMMLPHYNDVKDKILDGKRIMEDITYPDSYGRKFIALPDGSYIHIIENTETIYGDAYIISDGKCKQICSDGEKVKL